MNRIKKFIKKYILVISIFMFSIILTDTASSIDCGDGICASQEYCWSCPEDCGCQSGYNCGSTGCIDYRLRDGKKIDVGCGDNKCDSYWKETCYEDNCCGGKTVDFSNDNKNCGTCWNACKENYACEQGICIFNIKNDLAYYPEFFVMDKKLDVAIIVGDKAPSSHVISQTQIMLSLSDYFFRRTGIPTKVNTILASDIKDVENLNIISLGNACINEVSARILGNPKPCNYIEQGKATIEIYKSRNNKAHIVLNAYSDEGVKKASEVLSRYLNHNLKGNKFTLEVQEKKADTEYSDNKTSTEIIIEKDNGTNITVTNPEDIIKIELKEMNDRKIIENKSEVKSLEIKDISKEEQKNLESQKIEDKMSKQIIKEDQGIIKKIIRLLFSLFKQK